MLIKVLQKNQIYLYTSQQFRDAMGAEYLPQLEFQDEKVLRRIEKKVASAKLSMRQKWLGAFYGKEIRSGYTPDLMIQWVDEKMGYGVVANCDLPKRAYIGEYTGMVRKRKFFEDQKNGYCFVYTIEEGKPSRFIIDAQPKGNYTRFINHSDTPNLEPASVLCDGLIHIVLYTIKPIRKGDPLSYDYGEEYWSKRNKLKDY